MDIYETEIPICPNCKADMIESLHLDDLEQFCVVCPTCKVHFSEEYAEYRTEYRRQIVTTDDAGDKLIELQRSDAPDMAGAVSEWYRWVDRSPVLEKSFTGIDDQFVSIMDGFGWDG